MVRAGCVSVAGIHPCRTWMSGSFESVRQKCMCAQNGPWLGNGVRTHVNPKGKIPSTRKKFPRGGSNAWHCIKQASEPNTLPTSYSSPCIIPYDLLLVMFPWPSSTSIWTGTHSFKPSPPAANPINSLSWLILTSRGDCRSRLSLERAVMVAGLTEASSENS